MKNKESINLHMAMIPSEDKTGFVAFFAELPQLPVQAVTKEEAAIKLKLLIKDFPELLESLIVHEFELTEELVDLVA